MTTSGDNNESPSSAEPQITSAVPVDEDIPLTSSITPVSTSSRSTSRALLIAFLLSFFLIHLPLFLFVYMNSNSLTDQKSQSMTEKQKVDPDNVVMMDLNNMNLPPNIVDLDRPAVQKIPKKPTAQSLYNSSVKKETVASGFNKKNIPLGQPQQPQTVTENLNQKQNELIQKKDESVTPTAGLSMQEQLKMLQDKQKTNELQKYSDRFEVKQPTTASLLKSDVGSPNGGNSGDFLPNYKIGNKTYLNTLANPHIGYFVELRRKFRFAFNPMRAVQRSMNELTRGSELSVIWGLTVDVNGNISGLTLIRSSGHPGYDDEARQTIRKSAPFSKPPTHMLTATKQLDMAWTFITYL